MRATIVRLLPDRGGGTIIHLNRGEAQGIKKGMNGYVLDLAGGKVTGSDFTVTVSSEKRAQARTKATVQAIGDRRQVVVLP